MNWVKCVPFVGTAMNAVECLKAACRDDIQGAVWKLGETEVDGIMDATVVLSDGLTTAITTPGKLAGRAAGKVVTTAAVEAIAARALTGATASMIADGAQDLTASWSNCSVMGNNVKSNSGSHIKNSSNGTDRREREKAADKRQRQEVSVLYFLLKFEHIFEVYCECKL